MSFQSEPDTPSAAPERSLVPRKIGLLIVAFVALSIAQIVLSAVLMQSVWGLSAYQRALAEWSDRRQEAADAVVDFLAGQGDDARFRFAQASVGLQGFDAARDALFDEPLRESEAVAGLVRGGLREAEAAAVVRLSQSSSVFPRSRELFEAWQATDERIDRLGSIAAALFEEAGGEAVADARAAELTRTVLRLEDELEELESRFGRHLSESRQILQRRLWLQQIAGSAVLLLVVVGIGVWTARRLGRDAEQRRAAEVALRKSRERLREIVEHSTNLFYSHTADHELTYVSPQTRVFFDCEPEEALIRWTEFVTDHPVNREGLEQTERAIATGERQPGYELELQGAGGRTIWVEVNEAPVVRPDGSVAVVGALTDITERRRADEERERLKQRLRLGQKLEAVGRLAGGVAHDFNNLLTAILGRCDLLEDRLRGAPEAVEEVGEIRRAGARAVALTSQLLAFSRKQVIDPKVLDLDRLVEESGRLVERLIPESIELEWRLGGAPSRVRADPNQIEQLLVNLAINARDAMPSGGRLTIATRRERLESARRGDLFEVVPGDYVLLSVADTGAGMDSDTLERAFEPFYTTKPAGEGTGLGLATVYGIVKQNQGYIWIDTESGEGTTFSVYFPAAAAGERVEEDAPGREDRRVEVAPEPGTAGQVTVLLVEDEDAVRLLVRQILIRSGYTVIDARDGRHALLEAGDRIDEIDLLVSDLVMPGMSGEELARKLLEEKPDLAVLYITGYSEGVVNAQGLFGDRARLLLKPFTAERLIGAVRAALEDEPRERRALRFGA